MTVADELAAALRTLYAESRCPCLRCIQARIDAGKALIRYEAQKSYALAADLKEIIG
jgi:hypothetical protein